MAPKEKVHDPSDLDSLPIRNQCVRPKVFFMPGNATQERSRLADTERRAQEAEAEVARLRAEGSGGNTSGGPVTLSKVAAGKLVDASGLKKEDFYEAMTQGAVFGVEGDGNGAKVPELAVRAYIAMQGGDATVGLSEDTDEDEE